MTDSCGLVWFGADEKHGMETPEDDDVPQTASPSHAEQETEKQTGVPVSGPRHVPEPALFGVLPSDPDAVGVYRSAAASPRSYNSCISQGIGLQSWGEHYHVL